VLCAEVKIAGRYSEEKERERRQRGGLGGGRKEERERVPMRSDAPPAQPRHEVADACPPVDEPRQQDAGQARAGQRGDVYRRPKPFEPLHRNGNAPGPTMTMMAVQEITTVRTKYVMAGRLSMKLLVDIRGRRRIEHANCRAREVGAYFLERAPDRGCNRCRCNSTRARGARGLSLVRADAFANQRSLSRCAICCFA